MGLKMHCILYITALIIAANNCKFFVLGTLQPALHWKFDAMTTDRFVSEASSSTNNRGLLLPGVEIVQDSTWTGAKLKGNRSGILIDNVTTSCFLAPQNCVSGFSISFRVRWPGNSTVVNNGSIISSGNFSVYHQSTGGLLVSLWNGTGDWRMRYTRNTSVYGWVCYVVTWDHRSLRLYVNGSLKSAITDEMYKASGNGILKKRSIYSLGNRAVLGRIAIGNAAGVFIKECGVKMTIDDLKIWDFALLPNDTKQTCHRGSLGLGQNKYKYRDQAYTSIHFAHKALHGFTFSSVRVKNMNRCIHKCIETKPRCMSFNIGRGNGTDEYVCQLNKASREHFPHSIIKKSDYFYYDVYWRP